MKKTTNTPSDSRRWSTGSNGVNRIGLRTRLFLSFVVPTLLLSIGIYIITELMMSRVSAGVTITAVHVRLLLAALTILAVFMVALIALQCGDRFLRPIAWLMHAIDAGQLRLISKTQPPPADREVATLCGRVQVLLTQNLSGAQALEKLDIVQSEIGAVIEAADSNKLLPDRWPRKYATQPLTQRLLTTFSNRFAQRRESAEGIVRLQGLLEQDWREETNAIAEIVRRSERCFQMQTQILGELELLGELTSGGGNSAATELAALFADLRLGIEQWLGEVNAQLSDLPEKTTRTNWEAWIRESLVIINGQVGLEDNGDDGPLDRIAGKLEEVTGLISGSGQEVFTLSREVTQMQRAWHRLSERMRTLLVRLEEINDAAGVAAAPHGEDVRSG
jgi:hypothetical protein